MANRISGLNAVALEEARAPDASSDRAGDALKTCLAALDGAVAAQPASEVQVLARVVMPDATYCLVRLPSGPGNPLTPKQKEIAILIARGLPNKEVARRLGVRPATVASHLVRIFRKLRVDSRAALASKVLLLQ